MKNNKEIPQKVVKTKIDYLCPVCNHNLWELIFNKNDRCDKCNQKLDWGITPEKFQEDDVI